MFGYIELAKANPSSTIRVTANVIKFCNMRSTPFTFGEYQADGVLAKANVTVTCTAGTVYNISVSQSTRAMSNNKNDILLYSVYQDAARSKALGNANQQNTVSGVGTGKPEIITLYLHIQGGQDVSRGEYSDMLYISLNF